MPMPLEMREKSPSRGQSSLALRSHVRGSWVAGSPRCRQNDYLETLHALITRQETTKMPILVDLVGHDVRANGAPIWASKCCDTMIESILAADK